MTSIGQLNLQINFMRSKEIPPMVIRDVVIKLESNFLMDYDEDGYPSDVFVSMEDLFHTQSQVDKFIKTMEGATYRLKQLLFYYLYNSPLFFFSKNAIYIIYHRNN